MSRFLALILALALLLAACATGPGLQRSMVDLGSAEASDRRAEDRVQAFEIRDGSGRLALDRLLEIALTRSPTLAAARARRRAALQRRPQVTALPDPMLMVGWYGESIETRTGSQELVLGLQQGIPWPGKLMVAGDIADVEALVARLDEEIAARDLIAELVISYEEFGYLEGAAALAATMQEVYAEIARLALEGRDGSMMRQAEVARAETRLAQASFDRQLLEELGEVEAEKLRALAFLPRDGELPAPAPRRLPTLRDDLESVRAAALENNQELARSSLMVERAGLGVDRARMQSRPNFQVGARYIVTDERSDADPMGNGDDPWLLEVGISLPVQVASNAAAVAESRQLELAAAFDRAARARKLESEIAAALWRYRNAERLTALHDETLVPGARAALLDLKAGLARNEVGLEETLEAAQAMHQLELAALRARANTAQELARLERLVGQPLGLIKEEVR